MRKVFCWLLLFAGSIKAYSQNGTEPVRVTDMLLIKTVSNVSLSRDGSFAVFALNSIEGGRGANADHRYTSQIYMLPTDGRSAPVQLTHSRERASQPVLSPDGSQVAFVRPVDGKLQIFILPLKGGEPWQLTRSSYGASNPRWSPDGNTLLFAAGVGTAELLKDSLLNPGRSLPTWSLERPGFDRNEYLQPSVARADPNGSLAEIRAYLQQNVADNKARVLNRLNFQSETDLASDPDFTHHFLIRVQPEEIPRPVTFGFFRYNTVDFLPNGRGLILSAAMDSLQHPDRVQESALYLADSLGRNRRLLVSQRGLSLTSPRVSPGGRWVAYLQGTPTLASSPQLTLLSLQGGSREPITISFDRVPSGMVWSRDERFLYFTAQSNGGVPLYRLDVEKKTIDRLSDFTSGISSFDMAEGRLVFARTEVSSPSELYLSDATARQPRKISDFNAWVRTRKLSYPEKYSFTNEKGLTVEYWVMKPANFQPGSRYPLLLEIHGGPTAMWGPGEASMWHEFQYFCSRGYGVVYGNPRGSGGYGQAFLRSNVNDWGKGPAGDVLRSLDSTVALGWADTSKLMITGGSYAGYLVAWIIAHDKRFKAACSQRGVYDLATFFGEGNAWRLVPGYFGGYPWQPQVKAVLDRESPINYVDRITTPYIIFHGDNDRRTGFVQSEMLYRSLKVLGRPVEYVRHPGATHEITRSGDNRQRIDQLLRTYEFFERWIR
jgi:dipeptidyl aminopeptidase/acylaminoacyl peptidase